MIGTAYPPAYPPALAPNQPKEIGICQRMEGVVSGLSEMQERLEVFLARVGGVSGPGKASGEPMPNGLPTLLSCAETRLRECLRLMNGMSDAF